jgi:iron uptake system EfeUOB component EfeO/EfeM
MARASKNASDKQQAKDKAIAALTQAADHYKTYVRLVTNNHVGKLWLSRVGTVNFELQTADVMADIEIAKNIDVK